MKIPTVFRKKPVLRNLSIILSLFFSPIVLANSIVTQWNDVTLEAVRHSTLGPPMVARALAIINTCEYDAWAAYDPVAIGTRLDGPSQQPLADNTLSNKTEALSYSAYFCLVNLFPSQKNSFDVKMTALGFDPLNTSSAAATVGKMASDAVLAFRHDDGSNQYGLLGPTGIPYSDYTNYSPINTADQIFDPNHWQPLRFTNGQGGFVMPPFLAPFWGLVTPFALTSHNQFLPPPPFFYPDGRYIAQAEKLIEIKAHLTDKQKVIAEYWKDGPRSETPPGHWNLFASLISKRDNFSLDQDVKLFFALNNALLDAGIATWDTKRFYDSVRPITAVHFLKEGKKILGGPLQNSKIINGEDWVPYQNATFITPPFPEYTSGHSAFSAASAEVLKLFTGSDAMNMSFTFFKDSSLIEPGVPETDVTLSWSTFTEAADQAGISRRYGGIHFELGDMEGRNLGRLVGAQVWEKALTYFNGTAR